MTDFGSLWRIITRKKVKWFLLAFLIGIVAISTFTLLSNKADLNQQLLHQLDENEKKWQSLNIQNYRIVIEYQDFGSCQIVIVVNDGISKIEGDPGNCLLPHKEVTIPELFHDAKAELTPQKEYYMGIKPEIYITFDAKYGFPKRNISSHCNSTDIHLDPCRFAYEVISFEVL